MKTTIELTKAQIEQLTKADKEQLLTIKTTAIEDAEKVKVKAVEDAEKNYQTALTKLNDKYKTLTVDISDVPTKKGKKPRGKVDKDTVVKMFQTGKTLKDISDATGVSTQTVRATLKKLGLK